MCYRCVLVSVLLVCGLLASQRPAQGYIFWHPLLAWCQAWSKASPPLNPPFVLDGEEERRVEDLLDRWQHAGESIHAFSTRITTWQYDQTFGPKSHDCLMAELTATLKYRKPDCGCYRVEVAKEFNTSLGQYVNSENQLDHFRCDGKVFCEVKTKSRIQDVCEVPEARKDSLMQSGLVPFLFPTDADWVKEHFWCRETTPASEVGKQIWLEAWPKTSVLAGSIKYYEIILSQPELNPIAVQLTMLNKKDRIALLLENFQANEAATVDDSDFQPPPLPSGWKRIKQ